jgi:ubiquinone/menaquinone biosynthesis C-methylase UbiE
MHSVAPLPKDPLTEPGPWNGIAASYDEVAFGQLPELVEAAIELLMPESGDRVLDVASGPGTLAVRLAPRVGHVVAVDFAEVMIERLRGHIMRSRLPNLEGKLMDGEELDFEDGSFDAAVSLFGVTLFDSRKRGLEEMLRVVVPGGKALFATWAKPEENTLLGVGEAALRAALPEHPALGGSLTLTEPDACAAELEAVGFEQVATHRFQKRLRFASVDEYWSTFEKTSPQLFLLRQELTSEAYIKLTEAARSALLATCGDDSFELNASAILAVGEQPLSAA